MTTTELETLVVRLTANVSNYVDNFKKVQAQTTETTNHIRDASDKIKSLSEAVTGFGQATLAGLASLGAMRWFKDVYDIAGSLEQQFIGLKAAVKFNTDDVDHVTEAYKRFSDEMFRATGTSKILTLSLLQTSEASGLSEKRALDVVKKTIALAAATRMDPQALLPQMVQAETGSGIKALSRVPGLRRMTNEAEMTTQANRLMTVGMEVLNERMKSSIGMMQMIGQELQEVKKQFGKLLLEAVKPALDVFLKVVQWFKDMNERTKLVILSLAGMTVGVVALVNIVKLLNTGMSVLLSGTGGLLAIMLPLAAVSALWVEDMGGVSAVWATIKAKAQQFWDWLRPAAQMTWDIIRIGAMAVASAAVMAWEWVKASFEPLRQMLVDGWEQVREAASWMYDQASMWEAVTVAAASFGTTLAAIGWVLSVVLPRAVEDLLPKVVQLFHEMVMAGAEALPGILAATREAVRGALDALAAVFPRVDSWIVGFAKNFGDAMNWVADAIQSIPSLIKSISVDLSELFSVAEKLAHAFRWVNNLVSDLPRWSSLIATVGVMAAFLTAGMYGVALRVALLGAGFAALGDKAIPIMVAVLSWAAWMGTRTSILLGIITLLAARTDLVWQALAKVKEFFNWITGNSEWLQNLADRMASFFRWLGASIGPLWGVTKELFSSLASSAVDAFNLISSAAIEAFAYIRVITSEAFAAASEAVSNFNWNLQNTVTVVAAVVGIIAAMGVFLTAWAVAAKLVAVATTFLTLVMLPNKLALLALNLLWSAANILLALTGVKLIFTAIGWLLYGVKVLWAALATTTWVITTYIAIAAMTALAVALLTVSAIIVGAVVVAFVAAAGAVMSLVEAFRQIAVGGGWLANVGQTFGHWKDILAGMVSIVQVDMGVAWKYVNDAMKLAVAEFRAYWPPVWRHLQEGFILLWDVVSTKFIARMEKAVHEFVEATPFFTIQDSDRKRLAEKEKMAKDAMDRINEYAKKPLDLSQIIAPDRSDMERSMANGRELLKLKAAADAETAATADRRKKELDTATRLNNLAQQHNELKKAELVIADSAEAIYRIQAYRNNQQLALEARAARIRKEALDKEPDKGPAQLAFEAGVEGAKRGENITAYGNVTLTEILKNMGEKPSDEAHTQLWKEIRDLMKDQNKRPTVEMRPSGLGK